MDHADTGSTEHHSSNARHGGSMEEAYVTMLNSLCVVFEHIWHTSAALWIVERRCVVCGRQPVEDSLDAALVLRATAEEMMLGTAITDTPVIDVSAYLARPDLFVQTSELPCQTSNDLGECGFTVTLRMSKANFPAYMTFSVER